MSAKASLALEPESFRGVAWAKRGERWCAIDRRGRTVASIACIETDPMPERGLFPCKVER